MVVPAKDALGVAVLIVLTRQLPDDDGLVWNVRIQTTLIAEYTGRVKYLAKQSGSSPGSPTRWQWR